MHSLRPYAPDFIKAFLADVASGESLNWDEPELYYELLNVELMAVVG